MKTKLIIILILFYVLINIGCKSDINPYCWCDNEKGTIIPTPYCPYCALLILDKNPADTLMIINNIPKKILKNKIRVKVRYENVKNEPMIQPCNIYEHSVKIKCINKE